MDIVDHMKSVTIDSNKNIHTAQVAEKNYHLIQIPMITVSLDKDIIQHAFSTDKQLSHYAREAIIATCGRAAWILW